MTSEPSSSPKTIRIGLTDTLYTQVRMALRTVGGEPVDLVTSKSTATYFKGNPNPLEKNLTVRQDAMQVGPNSYPLYVVPEFEKRDGVLDTYLRTARKKYETPSDAEFLKPLIDMEKVAAIVRDLDGLVVAGGQDVNPLLYGEELPPLPQGSVAGVEENTYAKTRDIVELAFVGEAIRQGKPVFGMCRGSQIIAVALGSKMVQDIPTRYPDLQKRHSMQQEMQKSQGHEVRILPGSPLAKFLGLEASAPSTADHIIQVNSYHHQAVFNPPAIIEVGARDNFGAQEPVIEGFTAKTRALTVGVQWHPERASAESNELPASQIIDPSKLFPAERPHFRAAFESFMACARQDSSCIQKPQ